MKTLRARLTFYYSVMVTLTLAAALLSGFFILRKQLLSGLDFLLDKESEEIQALLQELDPPYTAANIKRAVFDHALIDSALFFFQIHNERGEILFRSPNLGVRELPDLTRSHQPLKISTPLPSLGLIRVAEYPVEGLHVQVATSLLSLDRMQNKFLWISAGTLPVILLLSILVGLGLSQITLRPLQAIQTTARRINATNLSERIPLPRGKDELVHLASLLNDMFERLERSFNQIKQITADASHELRTPLSIIRLHAEKALEHPQLPDAVRSNLQDLHSEVHRLDTLIDQLLILAKAEAQTLPLHKQLQNTAAFIKQFEEDAAALADSQGQRFEILANEPLLLAFDSVWLRQVLFNLLSNALKHNPPKHTIRLHSTRAGEAWQTSLSDEGPGVPSDQMESIFDRFTQINSSSESNNGSGLGLAVSKSIIELHGGRITAENLGPPGGFRVSFQLPLKPDNSFTRTPPPPRAAHRPTAPGTPAARHVAAG